MRWAAALLTAALAAGALAGEREPSAYLIRNVRIVPVSAPVIERGSILLRDGRIAALGARVSSPRGTSVTDGRGLTAYPGMIETDTRIGLLEIPSVRATLDTTELGDMNPHLLAARAFNPHSELIPVTRVNGVTTILARPAGGAISGQAALMNLAGWTAEEMAVRVRGALIVNWGAGGGGRRGGGGRPPEGEGSAQETPSGSRAEALTRLFNEARSYTLPAAGSETPVDQRLAELQPYAQGKLPVILNADRQADLRTAVAFGEAQKLDYLLSGASEADQVLPLLKEKKVRCLLGPVTSQPRNVSDPYDRLYSLPARLHQEGVRFALTTGETANARTLPYQAAMAMSYGLPADAALKSVTLWPAELLGIGKDYGSLDVGKVGNLFLADGDPLDPRTRVRALFIAGKPVPLDNRHDALYEKFLPRVNGNASPGGNGRP